jgi:hypothetical protein
MSNSDDVTVSELIESTPIGRPHVVLLGAGASLAACPSGDRNGRRLPLMANFTDIVALGDLVPEDAHGENFEAFYSRIACDAGESERVREIERLVYEYFDTLELPDRPTIYDYLVLSMRQKDVIATFNWDPFLLQAMKRNARILNPRHPNLLFLHGNVLEGFCEKDLVIGVKGNRCSQCCRPLEPSRLLYPVAQKNYSSTGALESTWDEIADAFKHAFMVTVFGYGAPQSDADAVRLLKDAWGDWRKREFEQFEMIDIRSEDSLVESWDGFIHSHHFQTSTTFFESSLGLYPRRSCEGEWFRNMMCRWTTPNPAPRGVTLEELQDWHEPLIAAERNATAT